MAARDTDADPEDDDTFETMPDEDESSNTGLRDPGLDRHDFASEWESVWEEATTDPAEALPGLEDIVRRMLERHGYVVDAEDPASEGDDPEALKTYASVREIAEAIREGDDVDPGDLGQAMADVRELYEGLIERVEGDAR
jgi:hypothetical protein